MTHKVKKRKLWWFCPLGFKIWLGCLAENGFSVRAVTSMDSFPAKRL
jgi:hypothetical protein